jgi:adenosylcobinamide-phosphate synthase
VSPVTPFWTAAGSIADRLVPDPPAGWHPTAWFGSAMTRVERALHADRRVNGVAHAAIGIGIGAGAGLVLQRAIGRGPATALATLVATGGQLLERAALDIHGALVAGDLARARDLLPWLVGRDPTDLDAGEIARAAIESVAENTVDSVIAPLVWAAIAGAPGVLAHRAVNTMDAMVGHHDDRYERYGWASARLDDLAAWVPARLTAALVVTCAPAQRRAIWRAVRVDAPHHPSPNSGVAEAAFAGALDLRLGGENRYGDRTEVRPRLGAGRPPVAADIERTTRLARRVDIVAAIATAVAGTAIAAISLRRSVRQRVP